LEYAHNTEAETLQHRLFQVYSKSLHEEAS